MDLTDYDRRKFELRELLRRIEGRMPRTSSNRSRHRFPHRWPVADGGARWNAAHDAFLAARDAALSGDYAVRVRLGAMVGNAALAGNDLAAALADLDQAVADAALAGDKSLAGSIAADKARTLVALGRIDEAARKSWDAVVALAPDGPEAKSARAYFAEIRP